MSNSTRKPPVTRHGMTIVELLVVMGILVVLMGIAATAVKTGTRGKKQREAARQVNSYIASAQARAMQLGRPVGVEIVRNINSTLTAGISNSSLLMFTIETPPPYAGDTTNARASITRIDSTINEFEIVCYDASLLANDDVIKVGDTIRLGYRGDHYPITAKSSNTLTCRWVTPQQKLSRPFIWRQDFTTMEAPITQVPYQLYAQPQRSSATPLQLPSDMCIDLTCSGVGNSIDDQFANWNSNSTWNGQSHNSVRFTFSPKGNIDRVSTINGTWARPGGNIHLLVGKYHHAVDATTIMGTDGINDISYSSLNYLDYISPTDPDLETNLADGTSMWVSINHLTGQITTTRNKLITNDFLTGTVFTSASDKIAALLAETRDCARSGLIIQGQGDE